MRVAAVPAAVVAALAVAAPASAAKTCSEPGGVFQRATPAEAGMDPAKLADAIDYGTSNLAFAVRVYRHGCLVGEDRLAPLNRNSTYESFSMGKSLVSLAFGRAMTLGLISPDDPVGSLFPEADAAHGKITMRHLLTMTSGVSWNGLRDYNFLQQDRVRDALTLEVVRPPGTWFEYAQSTVALLAEGIGRAVGEDTLAFFQRELIGHLEIKATDWRWSRDGKGKIQGFWGVNMRPDDYGKLGDLLRRDGVWRGKRLLSKRYMREAVAATPTNGCYGWLIWTNRAKPCIGARVSERPVRNRREFPGLPPDVYNFSGLFGQLVTVFPTQDIVVVRTGQDPGLINPAGGQDWESGLYARVMAAITDTPLVPPADAAETPPPAEANPDNDAGFQTSVFDPAEYGNGVFYPALPPAGPERARALRLRLAHPRASRTGAVTLRATCPARWPGRRTPASCTGTATLTGAEPVAYRLAPGQTRVLRFQLAPRRLRTLRRAGAVALQAGAVNADAGGGTAAGVELMLKPPA